MKILQYPNSILRKPCEPVSNVTEELKHLANEMLEVMRINNGLGLAAPQIGQSIQLFVMHPNYIFFNPKIVNRKGHQYLSESCLSFKQKTKTLKRPKSIRLQYINIDNVIEEQVFDNMDAICIQHEMDHLMGILFID